MFFITIVHQLNGTTYLESSITLVLKHVWYHIWYATLSISH